MKMFGFDTLDWRQIKIDWDAITDDIIKAGTPMDKDGHICNDGNAYGILMDDVQRKRNVQGRVVISGCMDMKAAEEHSGITLSAEAKAALPDVWTQSGGASSWNDLTDKPFYIEEKEMFFIEETTVVLDEGEGNLSASAPFVSGDTYIVMWDGQKYECVAQNLGDAFAIGNLGALGVGEPTEEPFVIAAEIVGDGTLFCMVMDVSGTDATTHTVSVSGIAKIVHKLDDVFIDTSVPFVDLDALGMPSLTQNAKGWASIDVDEIVINKIFDTIKKGKPIDFKLTRIVGGNVHSDVYRFLLTDKSGGVAYGANISDIAPDLNNETYGLNVVYVNCVVGGNNVPSRIDAKLISTVGT